MPKIEFKKVATILSLIVVLIVGGYLVFENFNKTLSQSKKEASSTIGSSKDSTGINFSDLKKNIEKRIEEVGARQAYKEFKQSFSRVNFGTAHSAAHIMGELLFVTGGLENLAICDQVFAFGCYHAFFGSALNQYGLDVISKLDKVCIEKFGDDASACQHGIGHGILEYFGDNNLVEALKACKKTTDIENLFGCTSGVFMEYNLPTKVRPKTSISSVREIGKNPYAPCNTIVPDEFKESCYYEQNQWWTRIFNDDFQRNMDLCINIPEPKHQDYCFLGLGHMAAPSTGYNFEEVDKICSGAPNRDAEVFCRSGASWGFLVSESYDHLAPQICSNLTKEESSRCIKESAVSSKSNN